MKKLIASSFTMAALQLITLNTATADGDFTVKGAAASMHSGMNSDVIEDGLGQSDKMERVFQSNFELKYEADQFFIKGSHNRQNEADLFSSTDEYRTKDITLKSRQTEAEFGYKAFSNDWITLSPTVGLREYKTTLNQHNSYTSGLSDDQNFSGSVRWTEVFVGGQVDIQWLGNNTLTANYQHGITSSSSRKAVIENNYKFDIGLAIGVGYKWHKYDIITDQFGGGPEIEESGPFISIGYTF